MYKKVIIVHAHVSFSSNANLANTPEPRSKHYYLYYFEYLKWITSYCVAGVSHY